MPTHTIRRFNPFNLQHGSDHNLHVRIQEVIYYGESQLWSVVNDISKANVDRQAWTQKLLHRELLFVLSYLGIASAIGQAVDVPIILRSLADSMAMLHQDDFPIVFDPDFLLTLDIGTHASDNKSRVVSNYECCWWKGRKPRDLALVKILDASCLSRCMEFHKIQLASANHGQIVDLPPQLQKYRDLLSNLLQNFLDTHKFATAMSTASETQWNLDMRRASAFHQLHEAALIKETAGLQPAPPSLPPTSYRWTWGEVLTEAEVRSLRQPGLRPAQECHSGYDASLREGRLTGEPSPMPSTPTSHGRHEDVPAEVLSPPPDTSLTYMPYLANFSQMVYDPLSRTESMSSLPIFHFERLMADPSTGTHELRLLGPDTGTLRILVFGKRY
ncbi:hypothetical protein BYT27DRAFT_7121080 [Phlegmacium glaucopus]|nr:hypothetical protein BYT27DRAFT_7121080 [Phlegmacium glaucopus]